MSDHRTDIRICYIGGGSRYWAQELMGDLALCPQLGGELVLYDIDLEAARYNVGVADRIFARPDARGRFSTRATADLADALRGSDIIVMSIEPGAMELRYADLEIPRRYGLIQTVGDTTGPGGMARAMRCLPVYQEYAHAIMQHCPQAWVINYTNPLTLCVAALYDAEPAIKAFGCCHEVFGTQNRLAGLVAEWFAVEKPDRRAIELEITGVNHFTWATSARWQGEDLLPRLQNHIEQADFFADCSAWAAEQIGAERYFGSRGLISMDFFRRFGAIGAAGDRHLVEFVPWYIGSEADLHRWGVVATPYRWRISNRDEKRTKAGKYEGDNPLNASGEEGVQQILALLGLGGLITNVNVPNRGQAPDLPLDAVVESYAVFGRDRVQPVLTPHLPAAAQSLVRRVVDVQQASLAACRERRLDAMFQALLADPLCVHLPTGRARAMFDEMVDCIGDHLSGWR